MNFLFLLLSCLFIGSHLFAAKVGLLIVATGKYDVFVAPLIDSARKYFCVDDEVTYYVFADGVIPEADDIVRVFQTRLGWPLDTLMRNSIYLRHKNVFKDEEYLFALDADMLFVDHVGSEIFGERVATMHPGFAITGAVPTYEKNPKSRAYVKDRPSIPYFAGGFFGGSQEGFIHIITETTKRVKNDLRRGIIAVWHDESQWNRYCMDYPPSVILTPSYCFADISEMGYSQELAERHGTQFPAKLVALTKNHAEYRE